MIITIIGSLSKKEKMQEIKEFFEKHGNTVYSPADEDVQRLPLIKIQSMWIENIKDADLIVTVAKDISVNGEGETKLEVSIGESTSYEMAIAHRYNKQIVFW